jgi:hypothetical protein
MPSTGTTATPTSDDDVIYHSIQSPHKQHHRRHRRHSLYLWKVIVSLIVISAGVALAWFHGQLNNNNSNNNNNVSTTSLVPEQQLSPSSSSSYLSNSNTNKESASFSYNNENMVVDPKQQWPELVGVDGDVAKTTIAQENPSITTIQVLPKDSMVTMDYRTDRVRIFVDDNNKVVRTPIIG